VNKLLSSLFLLVTLGLVHLHAYADVGQFNGLNVTEEKYYDLNQSMYLYYENREGQGRKKHEGHDNKAALSLTDLRELPESKWQLHNAKQISTLPDQLPLWVRVIINTPKLVSQDWIISLSESSGPNLNFYEIIDDRVITTHSINGFDSFSHRPVEHRLPIIPISFQANNTVELLFRIESSAGLNLKIGLQPRDLFYTYDQRESLLISLHLGLVIGILVYHLILFFSTRNSAYSMYSLFLLGVVLVTLRISGFGYQYLWPEIPWMINEGRNISYAFCAITATIFTIYFLQVERFSRKMYLFLHTAWIVVAVSCILIYQDIQLIKSVQIPLVMITFISLIVAGAMAMIHGVSFAKYYMAAWLVLIASAIWFILNVVRVLPYINDANAVLRLGMDLQILLMALALGYRVRKLQSEKIIAVAENKAKSDFLAKMSHEIRTPMSGVLGMSELLGDRLSDPTSIHYNNAIQSSGRSLLTIINDILDYSKIEAGRMELESIPFNIEELAVTTLDTFKQMALKKKIELIADIDPKLPKVMNGDPNRLKQIMLNFISNSLKFTDSGHIVLKIEPAKNEYAQTKISITDTGPGISEEKQCKLFKAFSQTDSSIARNHGGTGLGLVISKQIATLMNGTIGVSSETGKGSTFWVCVSLEPHVGEFQTKEIHSSNIVNRRILIADDNFTFAELLKTNAETWKMIPTVVHQGQEVLIALEESYNSNQPFDIISLDLFMPLMNGIEASKMIERDARFNRIPRILLTSADDLPSREELHQAGIYQALVKPTLAAELHDTFCLAMGVAVESQPESTNITTDQTDISINNLNILVAEDNKVNQMVITGLLKKINQNAIIVNDGKEALDKLSEADHDIDLVLMDCDMPVLDGYHATKEIRKMEKKTNRPEISIIALTAHVMEEQKEACFKAGMNDYLSKPIDITSLINAINKLEFE